MTACEPDNFTLLDLLELENLQQIQDAFAEANAVSALIIDTMGNPLTRASNFSPLCRLVRATPEGARRCAMSDEMIRDKTRVSRLPVAEKCHSLGLYETSEPIIIDGKHIANWLIGQIKTRDINRGDVLRYSAEIGADAEAMLAAFDELPVMSPERYGKIARLLACLAKEIATLGYKNLKLARQLEEQKKVECYLAYLSSHDALTDLYNRSYFEQVLQQLERTNSPLALIVCDVDGLKLINDTLGHKAGDELLKAAAAIMQQIAGEQGITARIGGDELAIILPGFKREQAETICNALRIEAVHYNLREHGLHLSLSIGMAATEGRAVSGQDLYKEADNNMYREKLHRGQSVRSAIVQTVMKLLEARDFITEGHADRLQGIVTRLGRASGFHEQRLVDLRLLAQFHDIGKVGIPDRILFKPGPLDAEEKAEMQRHCEIGHRIAHSSPDLAHIADWILKHHEWWDGSGYPLKIGSDEIPVECRILSIADAYDAMTSNRPYRNAMDSQAAVKELKRCAGTQFDPKLVQIFIDMI